MLLAFQCLQLFFYSSKFEERTINKNRIKEKLQADIEQKKIPFYISEANDASELNTDIVGANDDRRPCPLAKFKFAGFVGIDKR